MKRVKDINKERSKTDHSFQTLLLIYTAVMGVSFSIAAKTCFEAVILHIPVNITDISHYKAQSLVPLLLFFSYAVTFIPFYHGCSILFHDAYIENKAGRECFSAFLYDFGLMFLHGVFFAALATTLTRPDIFFVLFVFLMIIDVAWCLLANINSRLERQADAAKIWMTINAVVIALCFEFCFIFHTLFCSPDKALTVSIIIFCVSIVRSYVDYTWAFEVYFGRKMNRKTRNIDCRLAKTKN